MKFGDGKSRGMGSERTVNEALRQTPELEVAKLAVGFSARPRKTSDRALCRSSSALYQTKEEINASSLVGAARAPATSGSSVPTNRKTMTD
jgi:hypothetical protein